MKPEEINKRIGVIHVEDNKPPTEEELKQVEEIIDMLLSPHPPKQDKNGVNR